MLSRSERTGPWDSGHRVIAHIDMDAFFAAVEILDNPELKGKPVIVGGSAKRGVVSAASYEARKFGVHSAMPIFQAKKLCPHGIFLPVRMRRYMEVSRIVMACLSNFSPLIEQVSVDEAYIDLTGTGALFGEPEKVARAIKQLIKEKTSLTCSIGISTCKRLAKIASDMDKPDGLTIIPPGKVHEFLDTLHISKVPGIGKKSEEELTKIGIRHIGDLRKFSPDWLTERFGKFGEWLLMIAEGDDDSPVVPYSPPKSISSEDTLPEDTANEQVLKKYMLEQSEIVGRRLRKNGFRGRTITLKIKHHDFRQITRSVTLEQPTQLGKIIYREAVKLLDTYKLRSRVRLVGVGISNLEPIEDEGQLALFAEKGVNEEKWEKAERAVDEIVKRFGHDAMKRGSLLE